MSSILRRLSGVKMAKNKSGFLQDKLSIGKQYQEFLRTISFNAIYSEEDKLLLQENIIHMVGNSDNIVNPVFIDCLKIVVEACNACQLLLSGVHEARANYRLIEGIQCQSSSSSEYYLKTLFEELASFVTLKNPLLVVEEAQFRDINEKHLVLFRNLSNENVKINRRLKLRRRIVKTKLVMYHVATAMSGSLETSMKQTLVVRLSRAKALEKGSGQSLDLMARGFYILMKDFDTISILVKRLQNEIERMKALFEICVRHKEIKVLEQVMIDYQAHDQTCFLKQVDELERLIYICFITVSKLKDSLQSCKIYF